MSVQALSADEIAERGLNHSVVWYVVDETINGILGFVEGGDKDDNPYALPWDEDGRPRVTPVFSEKEDAETCKYIVSKTPFIQDHKLSLDSEVYQDVLDRVAHHPDFRTLMFDAPRAKEWFVDLEDSLITREYEETRPARIEPRTNPYD